ncbi:hypothetical protein KSP39_PZI021963 [Platanthera zijinensis]|uniref:Uncharacterized protein n=1 Tax=Platanthera zijinensis TaxID=2320716 RepID=A0AAP0FW52_9ASPA
MLWIDKYRPISLDKVTFHGEIAQNLKKLVSEQDCPHLLFYRPSVFFVCSLDYFSPLQVKLEQKV